MNYEGPLGRCFSCNRPRRGSTEHVQPQTCTERKTRRCRMLPEGTCEECPRTKWLVCLLREYSTMCKHSTMCGYLWYPRSLGVAVWENSASGLASHCRACIKQYRVRVSCSVCKQAVSYIQFEHCTNMSSDWDQNARKVTRGWM